LVNEIKHSRLSAGRPIAILHKKFADKNGLHSGDRIVIKKTKKKSLIAVVDIAEGMLKEKEIIASTEIFKELGLKENDYVEIQLATVPRSLGIISEKMNCKTLSEEEIHQVINDISKNALTEAEVAFFVSSIYKCGMSMHEIEDMTRAIIDTGSRINLKQKIVVDMHSIGGFPGRTTPIVVAICAAAGLTMPKTSSRAITSPAGTADALEVICRVDFTIPEIKRIIEKAGACIVWGGSLGIAPADDKIIQIERILNIDPEAQLIASIMAKKISVGSKFVLIEIPYGKFAKVNRKKAESLRKKFETVGKFFNVNVECLLTKTDEPIGNGIGPSLEIRDSIRVLRREDECHMLTERSLSLAARILELAGKTKKGKGLKLAKELLYTGKAFKKFEQIVKAQKGKIGIIPEAKFKHNISSTKSGKLTLIDVKKINSLARVLGCPLDKLSGVYLFKHKRDRVKKGEKILTLYSESKLDLDEGIKFYKTEKVVTIR
jgi:putative thymidine phosphorylase